MTETQFNDPPTPLRRGLWRSRWAAFGAAVAVTVGGGGWFVANATSSSAPSLVVTIDPVRILDTRTDVGLPGPFVSAVSQRLRVTGTIPTSTGTQTPVPAGATGVLLNVTVVAPSAAGFVSVRPGDATGAPSTSSLNFVAGEIVPNSVQVAVPTAGANAGKIDITYDAFGVAGPTTEVLIDVVGYMMAGGSGGSGLSLVGQFTPTQIVHGAILTCTSTSTTNTSTNCDGPKLNGVDVRNGLAPSAICAVVTGQNPAGVTGGGTPSSLTFGWDGTTWTLDTAPVSPLQSVGCMRP